MKQEQEHTRNKSPAKAPALNDAAQRGANEE